MIPRSARGVTLGPTCMRTMDPGPPLVADWVAPVTVGCVAVSPAVASHRTMAGKPAAAAAASEAALWMPSGGRNQGCMATPVTCSKTRALRWRSAISSLGRIEVASR